MPSKLDKENGPREGTRIRDSEIHSFLNSIKDTKVETYPERTCAVPVHAASVFFVFV